MGLPTHWKKRFKSKGIIRFITERGKEGEWLFSFWPLGWSYNPLLQSVDPNIEIHRKLASCKIWWALISMRECEKIFLHLFQVVFLLLLVSLSLVPLCCIIPLNFVASAYIKDMIGCFTAKPVRSLFHLIWYFIDCPKYYTCPKYFSLTWIYWENY